MHTIFELTCLLFDQELIRIVHKFGVHPVCLMLSDPTKRGVALNEESTLNKVLNCSNSMKYFGSLVDLDSGKTSKNEIKDFFESIILTFLKQKQSRCQRRRKRAYSFGQKLPKDAYYFFAFYCFSFNLFDCSRVNTKITSLIYRYSFT